MRFGLSSIKSFDIFGIRHVLARACLVPFPVFGHLFAKFSPPPARETGSDVVLHMPSILLRIPFRLERLKKEKKKVFLCFNFILYKVLYFPLNYLWIVLLVESKNSLSVYVGEKRIIPSPFGLSTRLIEKKYPEKR